MKKLLIGMVVASLASAAVAVTPAAFDFAPGAVEPVAILPGTQAAIVVSVTTPGDVIGANINVRVPAPFVLDNIVLVGGTVWDTNNNLGGGAGGFMYQDAGPNGEDYGQFGLLTNTGRVTVAPGQVVAKILISVPAGTVMGLEGLMVSYDPADENAVPCDWASDGPAGQDTLRLITPEPMTALLLLAAVPFLRRRHA